jgi:hypothetical protein
MEAYTSLFTLSDPPPQSVKSYSTTRFGVRQCESLEEETKFLSRLKTVQTLSCS